MFKFFKKVGPGVAFATATAALAAANEMWMQKQEQKYKEQGLATRRVTKTTNASSAFSTVPYSTVEVVGELPTSVSPK